ncbi:MAG: hypothetical protein QXR96_03385 [Candidatus Woesearchaeota archaeon]
MIILVIILVIPSLVVIFFNYYYIVEVKVLPVSVEVIDYNTIGINLDTKGIYFDKVRQNSEARRGIFVENNNYFDLKVDIIVSGNISKMISVSENNFLLKQNEKKMIIFYCNTENNAIGKYKGYAKFIFKRAKFF